MIIHCSTFDLLHSLYFLFLLPLPQAPAARWTWHWYRTWRCTSPAHQSNPVTFSTHPPSPLYPKNAPHQAPPKASPAALQASLLASPGLWSAVAIFFFSSPAALGHPLLSSLFSTTHHHPPPKKPSHIITVERRHPSKSTHLTRRLPTPSHTLRSGSPPICASTHQISNLFFLLCEPLPTPLMQPLHCIS